MNDAPTGQTYSTDREAAAARGQALGLSDIPRRHSLKPQLLAVRMGVMRRILFPQRGPQLLMSDLEAAIFHKKQSACLYEAVPATEGISIQLKYRPWKHALMQAWVIEGRPKATPVVSTEASPASTTVQHNAILLRSLLVRALHSISEKPVSQAWPVNCSRIVGRHSCPGMVLFHLGAFGAWRFTLL